MRTTTAALAALVVGLVFTTGCRHVQQRELVGSKNMVTEKGVISLWGDWIRDKGEKFDVYLHVRNESQDALIVFLHDVVGGRGKAEGPVQHGHFGIGERTIDFHPGQEKQFTFVCQSVDASPGPYHITIRKVYSNPNRDGKTYGEVLAEDVIWEVE